MLQGYLTYLNEQPQKWGAGQKAYWKVMQVGPKKRKLKCGFIKDPQEKKACLKKLRAKEAYNRVERVKKMLASCRDERCRKHQTKNLQAAQAAYAKHNS